VGKTHAGAGKSVRSPPPQEEGAAETCDEHPPVLLRERRWKIGSEF